MPAGAPTLHLERVVCVRDDQTNPRTAYAAGPYGPQPAIRKNARFTRPKLHDAPSQPPGGPRFTGGVTDRVIARLGLTAEALGHARRAATDNRTDLAAELIAGRHVTADRLARLMAAALDLPCETIAAEERLIGLPDHQPIPSPRLLKTCGTDLETKLFLQPRLEDLDRVAALLAQQPDIRRKARLTTEADIAAALASRSAARRIEDATLSLARSAPRRSARTVVEAGQAALLAFAACAILAAFAMAPSATVTVLHPLVGIAFAACLAIRIVAALPAPPEPEPEQGADVEAGPLPVYSVLVALYQETGVIERLVASLSRLDWPTSRIEIKLVCEADDPATIGEARRATAGLPQFEIVAVPPGEPRTKPKALNFVLPLCRGEFVALYDAEDEPDPGQLREAFHGFRNGPGDLACLQAPLVVRNGDQNWLTGLFALEYAALFRRLLPWLARRRLPLPLGGTSNHFRRHCLTAVGAWDSHNVTEDADLGMRLYREGWKIGTLTRPTLEDAPERWPVWYRQRTRWTKGWLQTWLVHMRQPRRLWRELGPISFAVFQMLFVGMLASALIQPVFLVLVLSTLVSALNHGLPGGLAGMIFALDLFNATGGFFAFVALSLPALRPEERATLPKYYALVHLYWLLIALASLRAVCQLARDPHRWEKTHHDLRARANLHDQRYRTEPHFSAS
ncbi:putative glycosyl transferase [Aurantimonas manganoxydans SI85-9A1]|uniref:Putative glycosyl transferase n=1 Tax=Aurantimonas manganoxydans (strain ATCC BAA-1229 / DSM 21871 / SI85-9A1) TaxID=287752 RepID=Q1YKP1_AURMS|nr:putative glycosyl transferase [Aurantimonas manganoxydans SI85-9A1]